MNRVPTSQQGAVWWGERRQVRRAPLVRMMLYDEKGTIRVKRALTGQEDTV